MMRGFKRMQARFHQSWSVVFATLVALICLCGFSALAEYTGEQGVLVRFDLALENQLHTVMTAQIAPVYEFISLFGSELGIAAMLILIVYFVRKQR